MINVLSALWERKGKGCQELEGALVIIHVIATEVSIVRDCIRSYKVNIGLSVTVKALQSYNICS